MEVYKKSDAQLTGLKISLWGAIATMHDWHSFRDAIIPLLLYVVAMVITPN